MCTVDLWHPPIWPPVIIRVTQACQKQIVLHNILAIIFIQYLESYKYTPFLPNMPITWLITWIITCKKLLKECKQTRQAEPHARSTWLANQYSIHVLSMPAVPHGLQSNATCTTQLPLHIAINLWF